MPRRMHLDEAQGAGEARTEVYLNTLKEYRSLQAAIRQEPPARPALPDGRVVVHVAGIMKEGLFEAQ